MSSFQDQIGPQNHCHGCGVGNPLGLQIKSQWRGEDGVCRFQPLPHHSAASTAVVNGGILASVVDCHCNCTAMANAYREQGRAIGSQPEIWCVTASLTLNYRKPTPIDEELEVVARVVRREGRKTWLSCTVSASTGVCVEAEMLAIEVKG